MKIGRIDRKRVLSVLTKDIKKTIKSRYLRTFLCIIILLSAGQSLIQYSIHRQKNDAKVLNMAGRQRMLSQRLAKFALLSKADPQMKPELERIFTSLNTTHQKLQYGSLRDSIPAPFSDEIVSLYEQLDPALLRIRVAMNCIVAGCARKGDAQATIQSETNEFLRLMDEIVSESEQVSKQRVLALGVIEILLFFGILLVLAYEWSRVVRPAQKQIDEQSNGLENKDQFISKMGEVGKIGYWELDLATGNTTWSREVYEIHQVSKGTPTNLIDGISFYAEHERDRLKELLKKCAESKMPFDDEFEFYDKNGTHKWVRVNGEPVFVEGDKPTKIIGVFQDITQRKQSQVEIEESRRYLELAIEGANLGIWDWDLRDNSVKFDRRWAEMLGLEHSKIEMKLETWESRVHPDDIKKCCKDIQNYMDGKTSYYENVHRMRHVDGHWVYILDRGKFSDWDRDGKPIRFTGTHLDITAARKLQEEQKFILSNANVGIWKWNILENILEWDDSMYDLYDVDKSNFTGAYEAWEKTLHPDYKEQAVKDLNDALAGIKDFDTTFAVRTREGKIKHIGGRGKIERNENGDPIFIYGINWDITEKKMYERQMEHNAKLASIGQLAAGVGHEINNPLTIISGYLNFLKSDQLSAKTKLSQLELVDRMQKAVDRIANIVKGLRTFARHNESDTKDEFDLSELVYESTDMIKEIFQKEGVTVTYENKAPHGAMIHANRGQLQQILVNLISNAKDASEGKEDRRIGVSLTLDHQEFVLEVSDNGVGMTNQEQQRIFDPFYTTKVVGKGTGLGLSIVHKLVSEMGGKVSVVSSKGVGSQFIIRFPAGEVSTQTKEKPHLELVKNNKDRATALIVDDEEEIRDLLTAVLEEINVSVTCADNGVTALDIFKSNPSKFDIVISDLKMPVKDGIELLKDIRAMKNQQQPLFVLLTGGTGNEIEDLEEKVDGCLLKPYEAKEIQALIIRLIENRRLKNEVA